MNHRTSRLGLSIVMLTLAVLSLPTRASAALIDYRAVITARNSANATLGFLADDPNYWTPLLIPSSSGALIVDFTLDGTSGTQINLTPENLPEGSPDFGPVEGRDSTSPDIAPGSLNYLYLGGTNGTAPGSTPQPGNFFSTTTGLAKSSESAVWAINVIAGTLVPQWVNTDGSTPTTFVFVQSNHVYAGGDPDAFHSRFPAPVTTATLHLEILSADPREVVPEPMSLLLVGTGMVGFAVRARHRRRAQA
jgi:hypothetical protein